MAMLVILLIAAAAVGLVVATGLVVSYLVYVGTSTKDAHASMDKLQDAVSDSVRAVRADAEEDASTGSIAQQLDDLSRRVDEVGAKVREVREDVASTVLARQKALSDEREMVGADLAAIEAMAATLATRATEVEVEARSIKVAFQELMDRSSDMSQDALKKAQEVWVALEDVTKTMITAAQARALVKQIEEHLESVDAKIGQRATTRELDAAAAEQKEREDLLARRLQQLSAPADNLRRLSTIASSCSALSSDVASMESRVTGSGGAAVVVPGGQVCLGGRCIDKVQLQAIKARLPACAGGA